MNKWSKTFSIQVLEAAKKSGATTILITGSGSPDNTAVDIKIETCPQRELWRFTISLTSAIVRISQWIALFDNEIIERFRDTIENIKLPIKIQRLPTYVTTLWS